MNHEKGKTVLFVALCSPLLLDVVFLIATGLICKAFQSCGNSCLAKGSLLTTSELPLTCMNFPKIELAIIGYNLSLEYEKKVYMSMNALPL